MLDQAWNSTLEFLSQFLIPEWGSLIGLLPIILLVVVVVWLVFTVRRFATAGPTRRGKTRITPVAPSGVHMPGPSWAPFVAAGGAALVFWGLVFGGLPLLIGVVALFLALLFWGREGLRDYDRIEPTEANRLPAVVHAGPPPGVHMPGPSFRPILASIGVAVLFFGLVFGGWILAVGLILTVVALLGWLVDARKEYVKTVEADATGHLENIPEPRWPKRLMWLGGIMLVLAVVVDAGILPPRAATTAAGGAGGSEAGGGSGPSEPGGGGPGATAPAASGGPGEPGGSTVVAEGVKFTTAEVQATGPDFTLAFDNRDASIPHDVDILGPGGDKLFDGDVFPGPENRPYEVTGLQPGSYEFICSVHPTTMTGTITVQ